MAYSQKYLQEVARQYGITPEELTGSTPRLSSDISQNLGQKLYNAPVSRSDQGFNYKTVTLDNQTHYIGGARFIIKIGKRWGTFLTVKILWMFLTQSIGL